jgi:hypothetical protein
MEPEDEAYAEWLSAFILTYLGDQKRAGRTVVHESEVWQLLGRELPEGRTDQKFLLKQFKDNVLSFPKIPKNNLN